MMTSWFQVAGRRWGLHAAWRVCGALVVLIAIMVPSAHGRAEQVPAIPDTSVFESIDRLFDEYRLDARIPGLVYGIVVDGRLVRVKGFGVQDVNSRRSVDSETLFRIASMTKSFTALSILKLRDEGRLSLDALVETYVPEMRGWKYPTDDSPRIRVGNLLTHTAGFVEDDPWGDRQTPMPEDEFTRLLAAGVPFSRVPGTAMEYSNLGYAILGRVIANVAGQPYKDYVQRSLLTPLGMTSSGYDVTEAPAERRALGYGWVDGAWQVQPNMAHGAFGAIGGLQTNATEYAKYVGWLLAAWPPRDGPDAGPVKRASVRELAQGANFPYFADRPTRSGTPACRHSVTYGMGWFVALDCDLGLTLRHAGGYPGYGSYVLLLPEYGAGVFSFANLTYAAPGAPVWDAALALRQAGVLKLRALAASPELSTSYALVARMFAAGSVTIAPDALAMNFLMDRPAETWARELASLKTSVGACNTDTAITATGALSGEFEWRCERGRLKGALLLAPTRPPRIQSLSLERITPQNVGLANTRMEPTRR